MLKVLRHGNKISVTNPVDGTKQELINVVFVEEGRSGGDASMSGSSSFLSRIIGSDVGLNNLRTHTHPVKADKIDFFPLGKTFPGHINRRMFSTAQIRQQENVYSRVIDGKPTYFTTSLDDVEKPDEDLRMSNEALVQVDPSAFRTARTGTANVEVTEVAGVIENILAQGNETLG